MKKVIIPFSIGIVVSFLYFFVFDKLHISISPSVNKYIFFKKKCTYTRNEYIAYKPHKKDKILKKFGDNIYLIKQLKCMPGDYVIKIDKNYYCFNPTKKIDVFLGTALEKSYDGKTLTAWDPKGEELINFNGKKIKAKKIPEGYFYSYASHPRSYDSKYLGLIKKDEIVYCLNPIW